MQQVRLILSVTLLFITTLCVAQKEGNNWHFGLGAGITFKDGEPKPLLGGQLTTQEGCSSISDENGNLLLYSDGIWAYRKARNVGEEDTKITDANNNEIRLGGNPSTTQSGVIIRKPESKEIFYIVSLEEIASATVPGFFITEVNINAKGGLGVLYNKRHIMWKDGNSQNNARLCEKISATKSAEGIWLVFHGFGNNNFYSFEITSQGLNETERITSPAGKVIIDVPTTPRHQQDANSAGYMKISPDGNLLAMASRDSYVELFKFDNKLGTVALIQTLADPRVNTADNRYNYINGTDFGYLFYGIEFSSTSNYLYLSSHSGIFRFKLTGTPLIVPETIINTRLSQANTRCAGALQLGPNGKIYWSGLNLPNLGVINNPNSENLGPGELCNFQYPSVSVGTTSTIGLPNFMVSYYKDVDISSSFTVTGGCGDGTYNINSPINFTITKFDQSNNYDWVIDKGPRVRIAEKVFVHQFTTVGPHTIQLIVSKNGREDKSSKTLNLVSPRSGNSNTSNLISTGILCPNRNIVFNIKEVPTANTKYQWKFSDNTQSASLTTPSFCKSFTTADTYQATLLITSSDACGTPNTVEKTIPITVSTCLQPVINYDGQSCNDSPILFSSSNSDPYATLSRTWSITGVNLSAENAKVASFCQSISLLGAYKVNLKFQPENNGCPGSTTPIVAEEKTITIKNCNPTLSVLGSCNNFPVALKNSDNVSGQWTVTQVDDKGNPINGNSFSEIAATLCSNYVLAGNYKATFSNNTSLPTNNGCPGGNTPKVSPELNFVISACPPPEIEYQGEYCQGSTIFISSRNTDPYTTMPLEWTIEGPYNVDLATEKEKALYFCQQLNVPGTYKLNLTFQPTDNGCAGSTTPIKAVEKTLTMNDCPTPNIIAPPVCLGKVSDFKVNPSLQPNAEYTWRFGDGSVLSPAINPQNQVLSNPKHTYMKAGVYEIGLDLSYHALNSCNVPRVVTALGVKHNVESCLPPEGCVIFHPEPNKEYLISAWASEERMAVDPTATAVLNYGHAKLIVKFLSIDKQVLATFPFTADPNTPIIDQWQKIEGSFKAPSIFSGVAIQLAAATDNNVNVYYDDIRFHPIDANMKSYVYDPTSLRLMAELDENNYATLYEYDKEGKLVKLKKETERGVKTIKEFRDNIYKVEPK